MYIAMLYNNLLQNKVDVLAYYNQKIHTSGYLRLISVKS